MSVNQGIANRSQPLDVETRSVARIWRNDQPKTMSPWPTYASWASLPMGVLLNFHCSVELMLLWVLIQLYVSWSSARLLQLASCLFIAGVNGSCNVISTGQLRRRRDVIRLDKRRLICLRICTRGRPAISAGLMATLIDSNYILRSAPLTPIKQDLVSLLTRQQCLQSRYCLVVSVNKLKTTGQKIM